MHKKKTIRQAGTLEVTMVQASILWNSSVGTCDILAVIKRSYLSIFTCDKLV